MTINFYLEKRTDMLDSWEAEIKAVKRIAKASGSMMVQ